MLSTKEFVDTIQEKLYFYSMSEIRILDPDKLRMARGNRTLKDVVIAGNNKFSFQQLHAWESGQYKPRMTIVPYLLAALKVSWIDISTEINAEFSQNADTCSKAA